MRIVEREAKIVRAVFEAYLKAGFLLETARVVNAAGNRTRRWVSSRGREHGGLAFDTQSIHRILTNPAYIGKIRSVRGTNQAGGKGEIIDGLHEPIVEQRLWDAVQKRIVKVERRESGRWSHTHLLKGLLRTHEGFPMSPSSVRKAEQRDGRATGAWRVSRYYVSQKAVRQGSAACPVRRVGAPRLDDLVRSLVTERLKQAHGLDLTASAPEERDARLREVIAGVTLGPKLLEIAISDEAVAACVAALWAQPGSGRATVRGNAGRSEDAAESTSGSNRPRVDARDGKTILTIDFDRRQADGRRAVMAADGADLRPSLNAWRGSEPRDHMVRAIAQMHHWLAALRRSGGAIEALAGREGIAPARLQSLLRLTHLGPVALRAALGGTLPQGLSLTDLLTAADHLDWDRQNQLLRLGGQA